MHPFNIAALALSPAGTAEFSLQSRMQKRQSGGAKVVGRHGQKPAPRKPAAGDALIDADGVVWLVETVTEEGPGAFLATIVKITRSDGDENAVSYRLDAAEFAAFCDDKGITLQPAG